MQSMSDEDVAGFRRQTDDFTVREKLNGSVNVISAIFSRTEANDLRHEVPVLIRPKKQPSQRVQNT